jgi:hypothetical protein
VAYRDNPPQRLAALEGIVSQLTKALSSLATFALIAGSWLLVGQYHPFVLSPFIWFSVESRYFIDSTLKRRQLARNYLLPKPLICTAFFDFAWCARTLHESLQYLRLERVASGKTLRQNSQRLTSLFRAMFSRFDSPVEALRVKGAPTLRLPPVLVRRAFPVFQW